MQIHIQDNRKEIKDHGSYEFPVHVSEESITRYEGKGFLWHWHPEIELTRITEGEILYSVNDRQYHLKEGQGLFCNSNALHSGYQLENHTCEYLSVTFHPRFIYGYGTSVLQTKYVDFIVSNTDWSSLLLSPDVPWQKEILDEIKNIHKHFIEQALGYELEIHLCFMRIWQKLFFYYEKLPKKEPQADIPHLKRLKAILSFLQTHYAEPLSLDDIAASVNICKSECCRFFRKHMKMTLFEYLMFFRIQQSLPLLKSGESITKTANLVGFSNPCYYGKIFRRYMNCTPSEYRKNGN